MRRFLLSLLVLFVMGGAWGQSVVLTTGSPTYPQDFNSLSSTLSVAWVDNGTIPSWYAASLNLGANGLVIGTGSSATGNLYNYGSTSAIDRTLGSLASGGTGTLNYGVLLSNGSSAPIVSLRIQYTGEQWRNGGNTTAQTLSFDYSTTSTVINSGTYTSFSALNFTSPIATAVASALDGNVGANRISFDQTITGLSIPLNSTIMLRWTDLNDAGNDHGLGIDDITITATFSSNTITTGTVLTPPFILATCATPMAGTVGFSFAGTFNASNIFTAQLSDDIGSFASPTAIGTLPFSGIDPGGLLIPIIIPAGTPGGTGYLIRVIADDPSTIGSSSLPFTITQLGTGGCASSHSDYYRSFQTGNWNTFSTWESSPDNTNWISATLVPTYLANTITIRNTHTVTVSTGGNADQLVISNGAILEHSGGIFTIENGTGDDLDIQNGGVLLLSTVATSPAFGAGSPSINVGTGAIVRVSATGLTGAGAGVNANNYVYQNGSILEYTITSSFSSSGVTYFPNAPAGTIPIFRANNPGLIVVGAAANTTFNGVFECNGGGVNWQSAGLKIFRNGITGTGNMGDAGTSGKFVINGATASLGGIGVITTPAAGLEIGTPTTVTMTSDKTITGNVSLLTDTYVELGIYNLTVSGTVSNATITSYVKTNGSGKLKLLNVGFGGSGKLFPIGLTSINPIFISSVSPADYSARIVEPITPPIYADNQAVLRTWYITSSVNSPNAIISFGYSFPGDCGPLYSNAGPAELGVNIGGVWNIHQTGLTPAAFPLVPGTFTVTPTIPINHFNNPATEFPYVIANNFAILSIDCIISTRAQKSNNTGIISWTVNSCAEVNNFEVQRSVNNSGFRTIGTVHPVVNQTDFSFTDPVLGNGTNLYRIKVNRFAGSTKYSNTVALIHNSNDILISSLAPNPVHNKAMLVVSSGRNAVVDFKVYNMSGSLVKQWQSNVSEGNNTIEVNLAGLSAGIHSVFAYANGATTITRFVKQ